MGNFKLYFYGLRAKIIIFFGILIIAWGLSVLAFSGGARGVMIVGIVMMITGIGIIISGKAMRFNYQRESGNIIHRGDW